MIYWCGIILSAISGLLVVQSGGGFLGFLAVLIAQIGMTFLNHTPESK